MEEGEQGIAASASAGLVFDLGMHRGLDTRFYLDKGFAVVALEANPAMCAAAPRRLRRGDRGRAPGGGGAGARHEAGATAPFFLNHEKDDWSSTSRAWAEKGGHQAEEIAVRTTTLSELLDRHGTPRYIKCDVEGMDEAFAAQLLADGRRPRFVSVEAVSLDALALLRACGYDRVQIVNQALLPYVQAAAPGARGPLRRGAVQRPHERIVRPRARSGQVASLRGGGGGFPRLRSARTGATRSSRMAGSTSRGPRGRGV